MLLVGLLNDSAPPGATVINITRSAGSVFAPSWPTLNAVKAIPREQLRIDHPGWKRYVSSYTQEMRQLYRTDKSLFVDLVELAAEHDVILACLCHWATPENPVCHRYLLWDFLGKVATTRGLSVGQPLTDDDDMFLESIRQKVLMEEGNWPPHARLLPERDRDRKSHR
jgi:hypothetical protein